VQNKLATNVTQGDKQTKHITLLSKLIFCPSCGRKLSANYRLVKGVSKNSYRCTSRTDTTPCSSTKSLSMNLIDSAVWSLIKADLPSLSKQINEINPDEYIAQMDNQLINLINREKKFKMILMKMLHIKFSWKINQSKHNTAYSKTGKTIEKLEDELNKIEEEKNKN
jgi:hypothetical protein